MSAPLRPPRSSAFAHLIPLLSAVLLAVPLPAIAGAQPHSIMPAPAEFRVREGRLGIDRTLSVAIRGHDDQRLRAGLARALRRWEERTGFTFARTGAAEFALATDAAAATLVIECAGAGPALPTLGEDESYTLDVSATQAVLRAPTVVGALRGLESLLQLLQRDAQGWFVGAAAVRDQPRFPWRGLMIDVCRHWQPLEVIKRNLDGMALVKLNVLHLHLTDDQGFRIESKTHPRLHERSSDGHYFTHDQIREIVRYAADRGIRVVPEFDVPGHATSWAVAYSEFASAPGPYVIERRWGVFDPVLDPTNEQVYAMLDDFLGEMAALFPDPYLHIGGDENNGKHWSANARIQAFIREHDLKDNHGLHTYFNRRIRDILTRHGKRMVGWDEILHPDLPKDAIVHSWRGPQGLAAAASQGHGVILSNGYYIDFCYPAVEHYLIDPLPADTPVKPEEQARVLGGEATMWAELVSPETIDSRIWPRTAAIAERLWSPREVNDVPDMYRRLAMTSRRLEEAGLNHERNRPAMLRRLAGDVNRDDFARLVVFVDAIEPVKKYQRTRHHTQLTQHAPLVTLADIARPESDAAREFADLVERLLSPAARGTSNSPREQERRLLVWQQIQRQLLAWRDAGATAAPLLSSHPVALGLADASRVGLIALDSLLPGAAPRSSAWRDEQLAALELAAKPHDAVLLPMIPAIKRLVEAASQTSP